MYFVFVASIISFELFGILPKVLLIADLFKKETSCASLIVITSPS